MLPREERLDSEMLEALGAQKAWGLKVSVNLAIEERVELVFERLDRLMGHGYDHNFNCTNFEGSWVNLVHAGRGPRLQLHNEGSVWIFRDM